MLALADKERIPIFEAEKQVIDATHAEVGAYLLLAAVHVAVILVHKSSSSDNTLEGAAQLDTNYLEKLGLSNRLPVWREVCLGELKVNS